MRRCLLFIAVLIMTLSCDNLIVAAYVWPSCHDDPVAREWF